MPLQEINVQGIFNTYHTILLFHCKYWSSSKIFLNVVTRWQA